MSDDIKEDKGTTKLDKVANRFDKFLNSMDTFESNLDSKVTKLGQKAEKTLKPLFVKALMLAGFLLHQYPLLVH